MLARSSVFNMAANFATITPEAIVQPEKPDAPDDIEF
jgi:hypothetical protein